jgi:hypothetical protein
MVIPRDITVDFSEDNGPGFVAQYPGKCMTADLCLFGDVAPGDMVKHNPDGSGVVHTICLSRDQNAGLVCSQGADKERRSRRTGYSEVHANDKPTKFKGTSTEDMGY